MKNHIIKIFLFLIAFSFGTMTALLLWQRETRTFEVKNQVKFVQDTASNHPQQDRALSTKSLLLNGDVGGCGNFIVYRATEDSTKVVVVKADKELLKLSGLEKTFDAETDKNIEVFLYDFGKNQYKGYSSLCFDAIDNNLEPLKLKAKSGKVTLTVSKYSEHGNYLVTAILENITFQTDEKESLILKRIEVKNVRVGWFPG